MKTPVDVNPDYSISSTSERWYVFVGDSASAMVMLESKGTAWGSGVVAVKFAFEPGGRTFDFQPAVRLGPPASTILALISPLLDVRCKPWLCLETTTAESSESLIARVSRSDAEVPV